METPGEFRVRSLAVSVYIPNLLYAIGQGAVVPVIALLALDLGATPAIAGVIVALKGLGTALFDAPAGVLVARIGERNAMVAATVTLALAAGAIAAGPNLWVYGGLVVVLGAGSAVWTLARIAYAMEASPAGHRGRVMSTMGGFTRMGLTIGPFLGGAATLVIGLAGPFIVQAVLGVIATATLSLTTSVVPEPESRRHVPLQRVLVDHRRVFATAGLAMVCVEAIRASRQVIIPLWGDQIGMSASQVSVIFGISAAMEVVAFYPVGVLMDRKGRKWASVPSVSLLALGVAAIPLTSTVATLTLVGILIGLANGMGAGLNMTLSSDLAPPEARSEFIGLWRLIGDLGTMGGPMLVAGLTSIATLGVSAVGMAVVGGVGAVLLAVVVPEDESEELMTDRVLAGQIEYYRARAAEYDSWFNRTGRYDKGPDVNRAWFDEVEVVRADLASVALDGGDVLELAPGTGIWTQLIARRARSVTAVDASPEMVEINRARLGADAAKVEYVLADLFAWEPERAFDAVVFCFWISHIPERLLDGFLARVARALRPGGAVFFLDAQRESASLAVDHALPDEGSEVMTRRLDDGREFAVVKNFWDPADLERRCAAAGLDVEVRTTERFFLYGVGVARG